MIPSVDSPVQRRQNEFRRPARRSDHPATVDRRAARVLADDRGDRRPMTRSIPLIVRDDPPKPRRVQLDAVAADRRRRQRRV